jgi:hypothetical protein
VSDVSAELSPQVSDEDAEFLPQHMRDVRAAMQAARGRALRLRAHVRALAAKLAAAEHAMRRDALPYDDMLIAPLRETLAAERDALAVLGSELDERFALVDRACHALDAQATALATARARARRR